MHSENRKILIGHLACFIAYAIFGVNIIVCKDLTSGKLISPIAIFTLRSLGAGALFWILSVFRPKEKVQRRDLPIIFLAAFLGYFVTQLTFLVAIPQITPMHCSIISSLSPIYTMFIAALVLKEPITFKKAGGVLLSLSGILFLILNRGNAEGGIESSIFGIILMLINGLAFSLYLGAFRPVITRYSVITLMKWIFLFSTIMSIPLSAKEIATMQWNTIPQTQLWELAFLIICATCICYFLIPTGQKLIRPTLVSMYSYVQPIIATAISIIGGIELLSWQKILAATMVFAGVFIVNQSKKKKHPRQYI